MARRNTQRQNTNDVHNSSPRDEDYPRTGLTRNIREFFLNKLTIIPFALIIILAFIFLSLIYKIFIGLLSAVLVYVAFTGYSWASQDKKYEISVIKRRQSRQREQQEVLQKIQEAEQKRQQERQRARQEAEQKRQQERQREEQEAEQKRQRIIELEKQPPPLGLILKDTIEALRGSVGFVKQESIAWSPDDSTLAYSPTITGSRFGSSENAIWLRNCETKEESRIPVGSSYFVDCIIWSPTNNQTLISILTNGEDLYSGRKDLAQFWSADKREKLYTLSEEVIGEQASDKFIRKLAWSPDGNILASLSTPLNAWFVNELLLKLWDAKKGKKLYSEETNNRFSCLVWSPDSQSLALCSGTSIVLWDVQKKNESYSLVGHSKYLNCLAWSPDGKNLISGSNDKTIHVYNLKYGDLVKKLDAHKDAVIGLSFSADGRLLASKSSDGTIHLWRTDIWKIVATLYALPHPNYQYNDGIAFHPKLPLLATLGDEDTVIRIWNLDMSKLLGSDSPDMPAVPDILVPSSETDHTTVEDGSSTNGQDKEEEYDVYFCHDEIDEDAVDQIAEQLKQRGLLPWVEKWDLRPGSIILEAHEEQIVHIRAAAVFIGRRGIGSLQKQQVISLLQQYVERDCAIIPVFLPDAPQESQIDLPKQLQSRRPVDFRKQKPNPLEQLIWGISGKRDVE